MSENRIKQVKGVLFDLDGTLMDSEPLHFDSWKELLSGYGVALSHGNYLQSFAGVSIAENVKRLMNSIPIAEPIDVVMARREELYMRRLTSEPVRLMPFAAEILAWFKLARVPAGLVTSSSSREVALILSTGALPDIFKVVITRDDVDNYKPHPEPYEKASRLMGLRPEEYLVFEDTLSGVLAAKKAGLFCIGVQGQPEDAKKLSHHADHVFSNLGDARKFLSDANYFHVQALEG